MRAYKRFAKRGFTLVELMIVVAIIGVLAALAIYGVRKYLASAKTSEAKNTIGAISRSAKQAFEAERNKSELVAEGGQSANASHELCDSAKQVPTGVIPAGKKYQPKTTNGDDFDSGDATTGWRCLKFSMTQPHYYQYNYNKDGAPISAGKPGAPAAPAKGFEAAAAGDLDGDGVPSTFAIVGEINGATGELKIASQVFVDEENE